MFKPLAPTNGDYKRWVKAIVAERPAFIQPVPGLQYARSDAHGDVGFRGYDALRSFIQERDPDLLEEFYKEQF